MNGLLGALRILTRLPVPRGASDHPGPALPWFPLVGAFVGLTTGVAYAAAHQVLPPIVAATLAIAGLVLLTGALHEDGLADSADAWGGGSGREDTLRIMRDPAHGTYGVLAVVFSVVVRIGALAALSPAASLIVLPAIHALSRATPVVLMVLTPAARPDGLGAHVSSAATPVRAAVGTLSAIVISGVLLREWTVAAVAIAIGVAWLVRRATIRRIGGISGDVLGAAEQLAECGLLLLVAGLAQGRVLPA